MRPCLFALALACASLFVTTPAFAQSLNAGARPVAGTMSARADGAPAALDLTLRTSDAHPDPECGGRVGAGAPDAVVDWAGGDLSVWPRVAMDATLTVIAPDGTVTCEDDTANLSPVVQISDAPGGRYAVWIGAFSEDDDISATLYAGTAPTPTLDADGPPQAGELSLGTGFGERTVTVSAAGQDYIAGAADEFDTPCAGFVRADRPALRVRYTGQGAPLAFSASADADLVLLAETPAGPACNDDIDPGDTDPLLVIENAPAGDYTVWVGTWGSIARTADVQATLIVSDALVTDIIEDIDVDFDMGDGTPYSTGTFSPFNPDADAALEVDFEGSEALRVPLPAGAAGGQVPNPIQGAMCRGFVPMSPSLAIDLNADGPLALRAESDNDLVLVARLPDGTWMCSDDADGTNPGIQIDGAQRGDLIVWVGTFSASVSADATVTLAAGTVTRPPPPPMPMPPGPAVRSETPFTLGVYSSGLAPDAPLRTVQLTGPRVRANVLTAGTVENPLVGDACVGFLTAGPSVAVEVATSDPLSVRAFSATDAVMVVRSPGGDWFCSDDAEGTEPEVTFDGEAGTYSVWLGTYSSTGDPAQMTLTVAHTDG